MKLIKDDYGRAVDPETTEHKQTLPPPEAPLDTRSPDEEEEDKRKEEEAAPINDHPRSDEAIMVDACRMLEDHSELDLSNMEVAVKEGEVTLKGTVPEKWMKKVTEDLVSCALGVKRVHNSLVMKRSLKEQLLGDPRDRPPEPGSISCDPAAKLVG